MSNIRIDPREQAMFQDWLMKRYECNDGDTVVAHEVHEAYRYEQVRAGRTPCSLNVFYIYVRSMGLDLSGGGPKKLIHGIRKPRYRSEQRIAACFV